jgi:ribosomal protein L37AE/L43A
MCKSCNAVVAGGAYKPTTEAGETAKRIISEIGNR